MTLTGAQVIDGFIFFDTYNTGDVYFPTAADIVAAFVAPEVNCISYGYFGTWYNATSSYYINIHTGTNVTYKGPSTLSDGESGIFVVSLTNVTPGSERVTVTWYYN